ncbi:MAG: tryptophan 2,3-dioxygenase family protein [Bacteroidia bacterium]
MTPENDIEVQIQKLQEKFAKEGQDLAPYLEGLYHSRHVDYWEYLNIDALLNLQNPRTAFPDEMVFIIYHQITELYFRLTLWELNQITAIPLPTPAFFKERLKRMINYFTNLTHSFTIMIDGMDPEQFKKFRLALYPASGFQSAQYRMIELSSTDVLNLLHIDYREGMKGKPVAEQVNYIYWRYGATETATGKKSLTLQRFEEKYNDQLLSLAQERQKDNLWQKFLQLKNGGKTDDELENLLRDYDHLVNVEWPMQHYKSAARYLSSIGGKAIPATGGTNWQKYLPPRHQKRMFYPELWNAEQTETWGVPKKITR